MNPSNHRDCADQLKTTAKAQFDTDVTVSTSPPIVRGPYTNDPFTCPHGVDFWVEPTGEQIARWARGGVR